MKTLTRHLFTPTGGMGEVRSIAGPPAELDDHVELRRVEVVSDAFEDSEIRAVGDGEQNAPTIIGHAAVFDRMSEELGFPGFSFRERINRGAFRKALDAQDDVRLLINHDGLPLARTKSGTLELSEDPRGLLIYSQLDPINPAVEQLLSGLRRRDVDQMSFGFTVSADEWVERHNDDGTVEVVRTITEIDRLFDVSVVTFPAYPQTDVSVRADATPIATVGEQGRSLFAARRRRRLRLAEIGESTYGAKP